MREGAFESKIEKRIRLVILLMCPGATQIQRQFMPNFRFTFDRNIAISRFTSRQDQIELTGRRGGASLETILRRCSVLLFLCLIVTDIRIGQAQNF